MFKIPAMVREKHPYSGKSTHAPGKVLIVEYLQVLRFTALQHALFSQGRLVAPSSSLKAA